MASSSQIYPVGDFDLASLRGSTLIVPAVSLGNVPQLAADLLVTSLHLKRVAFVGKGDTVVPFAGIGSGGVGPSSEHIVTGGLELYGGDGPIYVLLQRAPTLKAKKDAHVDLVAGLVHSSSLALTLVLASLDAANQDDAQLLTPHQRVVSPTLEAHSALARLVQLPRLQLSTTGSTPPYDTASKQAVYPPFLPGAGLARRYLEALAAEPTPPPSGALTAWVVEGDNRGDARALASTVLDVLGLESALVEPPSWAGLFGPEQGWSGGAGMNAEIYG